MLHISDPYFDNSTIIDFIVDEGQFNSVFELLEIERNYSFQTENEFLELNPNAKPSLTWTLDNIKRYALKETEPFKIENGFWTLSLSYFPNCEDTLNVNIKIASPNPAKSSKNTLKVSKSLEEAKDNVPACYPKGSIISTMTSLKINDQNHYSEAQLHSLICGSKSSISLQKIPDKILQHSQTLNIDIYFKVKYLHSAILNYINKHLSTNFNEYKDKVKELCKDDFKLLLKSNYYLNSVDN
jgi:hypothetical protein